MSMKRLIAHLAEIRSGAVCYGADQLALRLCLELPFRTHEYESGLTVNGWVVPQKWEVDKATIHDVHGALVYDGTVSALGVIQMSESMVAGMGGEELKKHCYYSDVYDDVCVYHCRNIIQNWVKDWGFSMPKRIFDTIKDRDAYHVELRTRHEHGTMKVLEYVLPGESEEAVVLCAHSCHPNLANDDLSGIAVGIQVMHELAKVPNRRLTYRLLIGAEHLAPIFHINRHGLQGVKYGLFLESLGSSGELALQSGFAGDSLIDRALRHELGTSGVTHRVEGFREIVGNCETVWQAHGVECPSLSRCFFPEYHTEKDSPDLMSEEKLQEAVQAVHGALMAMDRNSYPVRRFQGLIALSNPMYDLYRPMMDPSVPALRSITPEARSMNKLMDALPQLLYGEHSVLDIAERFGLRFQVVLDYLKLWEAKNLLDWRNGPVQVARGASMHHGRLHF